MERNRGATTIIPRRPKKKYSSIKFDFKYSKTEIKVLETKIYKNNNGKLCLTIYRKPTDWQNYLHFKSAYPPSLKKSIAYFQALRISNICTETNEVTKHLTKLKETFLKHGYQEKSISITSTIEDNTQKRKRIQPKFSCS